MPDRQTPLVPFDPHDHADCRRRAMDEAERQIAGRGLRLTEIRRQVLEILLESHSALGAYDVLARLNTGGRGAQPPIAYRALDFLVENGFAHRIESLNAFVACACPEDAHRPAFLICRGCRKVAETPCTPMRQAMSPEAKALGFRIDDVTVEAQGLCAGCAEAAA